VISTSCVRRKKGPCYKSDCPMSSQRPWSGSGGSGDQRRAGAFQMSVLQAAISSSAGTTPAGRIHRERGQAYRSTLISGTSSGRRSCRTVTHNEGIADVSRRRPRWRRSCLQAGCVFRQEDALALRYLLIEAVEPSPTYASICSQDERVACSGYVDCIVKAGENGVINVEHSKKMRNLRSQEQPHYRYWIIMRKSFSRSAVRISAISDSAPVSEC